MKVLFVVDHAPDYREPFFRSLATKCNLTVLSHPCEPDQLIPPNERDGYKYIEIPLKDTGPFRYIEKAIPVDLDSFDVLCIDFNPRQIWRSVLFFRNRAYWNKWIWWGHVYGRSDSNLLGWIRRFILKRGALILVYSRKISEKLKSELPNKQIVSFNNAQSFKSDFKKLDWPKTNQPHFIFVGRPQARKKLDRIVEIAKKYPNTRWRLIGPDMEDFLISKVGDLPDNITCYGKTVGEDLIEHFKWCHAVINPGHLGLLISNAALHGRPVIVEKNEIHAPEVALAEESEQFFIDFTSDRDIEMILKMVEKNQSPLKNAAKRLQKIAYNDYTFEHMVEKHIQSFERVT